MSDEAQLEAFIKFTTDHKAVDSAVEQETKKLQQIVPAANKAEKATDSFFKSLRQSAGRKSELGEITEMLRGAGAVAGITMMGEGLAKATDRLKELNTEFRKGNISALELQQGLLESIPIIGGFAKAGHNIHDMFSSDASYAEAIKSEIELTDKLSEMRTKASYEDKRTRRSYQNDATASGEQSALLDTHPGTLLHSVTEQNNKLADAIRGISDSVDDVVEKKTLDAQKQKDMIHEAYKASTAPYRNMLTGQSHTDEQVLSGDAQITGIVTDGDREFVKDRRAALARMAAELKHVDDDLKNSTTGIKEEAGKATKALNAVHQKIVDQLKNAAEMLHNIANSTELIGKNPLDKFEAQMHQQGFSDDTIDKLMGAKGKELGAEMHESLKLPMERYQDQMNYLKEMLAKGNISQQDYFRGSWDASSKMASSVKSNSVEGAFMDNIKNRFIEQGINGQMDDLGKQLGVQAQTNPNINNPKNLQWNWDYFGGGQPPADQAANPNKSKVDPWGYMHRPPHGKAGEENKQQVSENTDQLKTLNDNLDKLNDTLTQGVPAAFS